ncbi:MAG TPA: hypothetical protein PKL11_02120, partial [Anaerolineaceae bacterium]|nr:hypothetical protein [Anaerolineaceae bacterium]
MSSLTSNKDKFYLIIQDARLFEVVIFQTHAIVLSSWMSVNERAAFSLQASQVLPATVLAPGSLGG